VFNPLSLHLRKDLGLGLGNLCDFHWKQVFFRMGETGLLGVGEQPGVLVCLLVERPGAQMLRANSATVTWVRSALFVSFPLCVCGCVCGTEDCQILYKVLTHLCVLSVSSRGRGCRGGVSWEKGC
jgi:hypothetical protein